jgi:hypothetical protein
VAERTQKSVEDVLVEWLTKAAAELPVEVLNDTQVLALCDIEMEPEQQTELSQLLAKNREGTITLPERQRLDALMQRYRRGLLRKAEAWKTAVSRGLKSPQNLSAATGW